MVRVLIDVLIGITLIFNGAYQSGRESARVRDETIERRANKGAPEKRPGKAPS